MRFFDEHDKGWGYIAPEIPEASIGVRAGHRGRGIGRSLLNALADAARATGVTRICLSVERDNIRAFELYKSIGYRMVDSGPHSDTMLLNL